MGGTGPSLGILLTYPGILISEAARTVSLREKHLSRKASGQGEKRGGTTHREGREIEPKEEVAAHKVRVSFLGSGNYATAVLIPAFKAADAELQSVVSTAGASGVYAGRKFGFTETTTDCDRMFFDLETDAVVITTRHDSHARFVVQALEAGKHVFVEKPLSLTLNELDEIEAAYDTSRILMVGFNRRFCASSAEDEEPIKRCEWTEGCCNNGECRAIPADHWTQDLRVGGGRVIGEALSFY